MKKAVLLSIYFALLSCNGVLNKSVFEPLSIDELKKGLAKDTSFVEIYKYTEYIRDTLLTSEIDRVKYSDLTYSDLLKYMKKLQDTTFLKPHYEKFEKEWSDKYSIYEKKVDSISTYWKKVKEENSLDKHLKIELAAIDTEYYEYIGGVKSVSVGFKLTPLKGKIEQVRFGFLLEPKIKEDEENAYTSALDWSWCLLTTPFSKEVIRYWDANYKNEDKLKGESASSVNRDYNVKIDIDKIRVDGVNLSMEDLKIPKSLKDYWRYENKEYLKDLYMDDVIKEVLGEEYIPSYKYVNSKIKEIIKEKYPIEHEYLSLKYN